MALSEPLSTDRSASSIVFDADMPQTMRTDDVEPEKGSIELPTAADYSPYDTDYSS